MTGAIEKPLKHAKFLARHLSHCDYSTVIILVLYEMGIDPKNDGYICLRRAITMQIANPTRHLKNDIYEEISIRLYGAADNERVEQAIRRSIAEAWKNRNENVWALLFPQTKDGRMKKPSNGDFIARVAWFVELWQGCCEEVAYAKQEL